MGSWQVRDSVHGFVELNRNECALLDTRLLQRLRGIRQLAMAYLVYPGAVHTRFDHSLGVLHVARSMCRALDLPPDDADLICLAALLHDIGHGPFSHVSEAVLQAVSDADLVQRAGKREKIHELITRELVHSHADIGVGLNDREREEVCKLLGDGYGEPINRAVISGPLDADKQDYLLRDSRHCGVQYGIFDLPQLHSTFIKKELSEGCELMIDPDGVHALEQFVLAKYYLTTQVYRHRVRLITDQMLIRALTLGVQVDRLEFLRDLFQFEPGAEYSRRFVDWDDHRLTSALLQREHQQTWCGKLFARLASRRLYKRIYRANVGDGTTDLEPALSERVESGRDELEHQVADVLNTKLTALLGGADEVDRHEVILHRSSIGSVREQSRNSEASILVWNTGDPRPFEEVSVLFRSINEEEKSEYIEFYAPLPDHLDDADRKKLGEKLNEAVGEVLRRAATAAAVDEPEDESRC